MIRTFRDQATADLFNEDNTRRARQRLSRELWTRARRLMDALDKANRPGNLRQYDLERLKGDRAGQYSLRINDQYRVCFTWKDDNAYDVEVVDYHE